ncbi:hypothetical protein RRU94_10820 [Domibacillus sp. DTU_2020_1001157_1_SI_ALB_TIR_016]|uniref:hypothetical protein n=1 Tax=Domibacillus sp. DTU_2020_1001157_1_SI_ALB_TIR_016 TaxID=3077789 RepID=UPI0028E26DDF|nr:hypothetical protein [Domibacillus sp. DTU_2020_1001157_1_SI_ALB_TIR_016]WNS81291.1 hypothetical protein RRU94_10820 [Domibacillus sp. DTU_2020_1001157_1_SI_ALB_TIR_016]
MKIQPQLAPSPSQTAPAAVQGETKAAPASNIAPTASAPSTDKQPAELAVFTQKGVTLTKEAAQAVQTFMETAPGTKADKLATVKALADKGIMPSEASLKAVHAALTGTPFGRQAAEWLAQSDIEFPENIRAAIDKALQLGRTQEAITAIKSSPLPEQVVKQIEVLVKQTSSPVQLVQALKNLAAEQNLPAAQLIERAGAIQAETIQNTAKEKLGEALNALLKQQPADTLLQALAQKLDQNGSLEEIVQALRTSFTGNRTAVLKSVAEALQLADLAKERVAGTLQPSGIILPETDETEPSLTQRAAAMIQKEPSFERVAVFVRDTLPELHEAVERAETLAGSGKELAARGELMKAVEPLIPPSTASERVSLPDDLFAHVPPASKTVVMTTITEKMSQSAIDFKQFKRDIVRNLQTAELLVKTPQQAKPVVETAIKTLDNAILKGNFMLFTDMKTEKELMQASQQLADARKLLAKGDTQAASRIVSDVKTLIDKVTFKPSDARVIHMATQELADTPQRHLAGAMAGLYDTPSARNAFELVRAAGLNFEHEQAASLLKGKAEVPNGVKQALLASMGQQQSGGSSGEQAAANLTGQQLLSKPETGLQSMMMSLPFLLGGQADNVNVFIRSKNGGQQVDWENCSLHFLFETKKLGPVGMTITAADRNLSLKVQNDQEGFEQKMAPLAAVLKNRLSDIGYRVGAVQFGPFAHEEKSGTAVKQAAAAASTKGFDLTI